MICEGDPLFYGSYMHLHARLAARFPTEIVAGVTGMSGCWSAAGMPIAQGDDVFTVLPATLPEGELARRLAEADAAVVMKVGRHLPKLRRALATSGRLPRAIYVERGTMAEEKMIPLSAKLDDEAPYFAVVLVPGWEERPGARHERPSRRRRSGTGRSALSDAGSRRCACATRKRSTAMGLISTACRRAPARAAMPPTIARKARAPPPRCATPRRARRSPSSPAAIRACSPWRPRSAKQIEAGPDSWRALDVVFIPGITAMLAVAAKIGAPLGHDFCALSLSDNLKPWDLVERRLDAAAGAGFVIALYNPVSRARPWQFGNAIERLRRHLPAATPVVFGRAVGRPDEHVSVTTLAEADATPADMATLVIVGTRETRVIARPGRPPLVYTPRAAAEVSA